MSHTHHHPLGFSYKKRAARLGSSMFLVGQAGFEPARQVRCNTLRRPQEAFGWFSAHPLSQGGLTRDVSTAQRARTAIASEIVHGVRRGAHCERRDSDVVHNRMFTSGPRPRCLHYTTPCLPCDATNVLQICRKVLQLQSYPQSLHMVCGKKLHRDRDVARPQHHVRHQAEDVVDAPAAVTR